MMRAFLVKIFLYLLPLLIGFTLIEISTRRIPNDFSFKKNMMDSIASDIEVLILGSSHTYHAIDPEKLSRKSFNLSNNGQPLLMDYCYLKHYGPRMSRLKWVVVPVSYFSYFYRLELNDPSARIQNYHLHAKIASSFNPFKNFETLDMNLKTSVTRNINWYLKGINPVLCSKMGHLALPDKNIDFLQSAKDRCTNQTIDMNEPQYVSAWDFNMEIVDSIVKWAEIRKIRLVFITTPVHPTFIEQADSSQLYRVISTTEKIATQYHLHVSYHNFFSIPSFCDTDFHDADHLSHSGALKFTEIINEIVQEP